MREPTGENTLDLAMKRLERALAQLEQRRSAPGAEGGGQFDQDRAKLPEELDQSKAREKALEAAGADGIVSSSDSGPTRRPRVSLMRSERTGW